MVINTKEEGSRIKLLIMLVSVVMAILVVLSLILSWSETHMFELGIGIAYILFIVFIIMKNFCYIYYNSDGPKVIIRYSALHPLSYGNFSIEIPRKDFVKAEIKTTNLGLGKNLIIFVRTTQGVAKFKPVSLTAISSKLADSILEDLSNI